MAGILDRGALSRTGQDDVDSFGGRLGAGGLFARRALADRQVVEPDPIRRTLEPVRIGETVVMASDCPPGKWGGAPTGFSLCIGAASGAEAEQLYGALSDGGTIVMAMGETFFAHRFGQFVDKFGVPWMIICEKQPD